MRRYGLHVSVWLDLSADRNSRPGSGDKTPLLVMDDLTFAYGRKEVLHGLTGQWRPGVVGLLGLNGAGKTTLLRVLATTATPSDGVLRIAGHDPRQFRARSRLRKSLGYLPQDASWHPAFTVREFGHYFAWLHGVSHKQRRRRVDEVLDTVDLTRFADERLGRLSGGQRRRAMLVQALVHQPTVLILDEPTAGLDPEQRVRVRNLVRTIAADRLVILSTHLVEDVGYAADRVVVLHEGRFVFDGDSDTLKANAYSDDPGGNPLEQGFHRVITNRAGTA